MDAIVIKEYGPASVLQVEKREIPQLGKKEVLIKVAAAGVNRPDIFQRKGHYPAPAGVVQDIPGLEVSGTIEAMGEDVTMWELGEEVCALVPGGGYAEYVTADEGSCVPIPQGISLEEAAALPEVLFTVWHNVFQRGRLKSYENILIYGGSGGIGSMAIQLSHLTGAKAYTLVSSEKKAEFCFELGAEKVIDYSKEDVLHQLGKNSVNVILDSIGGENFSTNLDLLRPDGRLVYINAMEGVKVELNIMKLMQKRLYITGSTLRSRSFAFKKELAADILENAFPLIESNAFRSMVKYRFPFKEAAQAHALMESRNFMGKIILIP